MTKSMIAIAILLSGLVVLPERTVATKRILMFSATWCAPCREMKATSIKKFGSRPGWIVGTYGEANHISIVDIDARRDVFEKYKITSMPTLLLIDAATGKVLKQRGYTTSLLDLIELWEWKPSPS